MDLLIIAPNDYDAIKKKGVLYQYENYREGGFFKNIISLFPVSKKDIEINLDGNKFFYQYGWKFSIKFLNRFKVIKLFGAIIIFLKLLFIFPFIIKKYNIKIIRSTDPYYMGLLGLYYSKIFNIPFVVSIHSDYDLGDKLGGQTFKIFGSRKLAQKLEKFVYKKADKILPIREYLKLNIISKFNLNENKVEVFTHGIDFNKFDEAEFIDIYKEFSIDKSQKIISFIGRLSNENYIYDLIEVARKLKIIRNDFVLLIVGNGNEYNNIQKVSMRYDLEDVISFVGFQNKNMVINVRKQNHVALTLMGGFSLIEACAGGRPVIAYDIEWHYELVKNNKTGFLIEENNIDAIVKKIVYLMDNPNIANKFGTDARRLVFERHNISAIIENKQYIYGKVLNEK